MTALEEAARALLDWARFTSQDKNRPYGLRVALDAALNAAALGSIYPIVNGFVAIRHGQAIGTFISQEQAQAALDILA